VVDLQVTENTFHENRLADEGPARGARSKAPVFVLGCGRSGTKFLYHTLLSAGGFAVYHAESNAFNLLGLRFGNLARQRNRRRLLDEYYTSKLFHRTGLEPKDIDERAMNNCRNAGDFLRIVMEAIARKQGVERWAETTPLHLLYIPLIKRLIPEALVVHIIRDGRDVTASLNRIGWIRPLPWDRNRAFLVPAIYWRWVVSKGRQYGRALGADYLEVHYEDLVQIPRETLAKIGQFIEHDLDYDHIQRVALGSVHNPNSSFRGDGKETEAATIGRWKRVFTATQVRDVEWSLGNLLVDTGYILENPPAQMSPASSVRFMNFLYPLYFDFKIWLKSHTPLARIADKKRMGIAESESRTNRDA
jgi:Sulfotransferase family